MCFFIVLDLLKPMVSMYGIYIWLILMINVGTYTIVPWIRHGKQRFVSFKLLERPMSHLWRSRWRFQTFLIFTPILGEMIQFDEYIFQMGWNKPSTTCFFRKSETCFFSHPGHSNLSAVNPYTCFLLVRFDGSEIRRAPVDRMRIYGG